MARTHANPPLDRDALHRYLWDRSDRKHHIVVHQQVLAGLLDVSRGTIVRIFKEMVDAGRIRKLESQEGNIGLYTVTDPDDWGTDRPRTGSARRVMWG